MKKLRSIAFLTLLTFSSLFSQAQDFDSVPYGTEARQFVDIYIAPSTCPTPVYFDAHFNGGTTAMPASITNSLTSNGISVVSWESLTTIASPADIQTGWDDAALMFAWVKANAATYNFDTTNFIIGGSSRGTILSWKEAHKVDPDIKGLYMYNALPSVFSDSAIWYPPNDVTADSPPIFFVYAREPGCSTDPVDPDIHDPDNGIIIQNTYDALGIGDRDTLIHSLSDSANSDRYQYLLDFANSVLTPCWTVGIDAEEAVSNRIGVYPNPFDQEITITGLNGNEQFVLQTITGQVLMRGSAVSQMDVGNLNPGIYLLSIEAEGYVETVRLIKR